MATTHQDTNVNQLVINKMTKQEYDNLQQVSGTELYLVEEQVDSVVTQGSTNPVQSGAVYNALQDIGSSINDGTTWFIKNNQTVGIISANQALDKIIKIPNDIVMCKMSDGIVYDSYITYTKIKQYLPDYPYYSDDLNWEIGGNPPMRASITEGNYYLDVDTNHIFVADENLELLDITSSVVIQGDTNKLYCDIDTNILYRYDGNNFVALTSNFSGSYNDLSNKPLSVENSKVKYTLSDGTTKLTLAQEDDVKDIGIDFTSSTVSGNIASGETLAVMMKKIKQALDIGVITLSNVQNRVKNTYGCYGVKVGNIGLINLSDLQFNENVSSEQPFLSMDVQSTNILIDGSLIDWNTLSNVNIYINRESSYIQSRGTLNTSLRLFGHIVFVINQL